METRVLNRQRITRCPAASLGALTLCFAVSAHADTTTITLADATELTNNTPVTMQFLITRSSDLGYDTVLNYHTVDGSAFSGVDYTGTTGTITIPAGSTSSVIPITIAANTFSKVNQTFQLLLDSATGIGPTPSLAAQQTFATGSVPYSVAAADLNGDGKLDLIVANGSDSSVSLLLNTTTPGAATPSFAAQQTLATGSTPISVAIADMNGDGKPDLIVANYASNTVSVLLNTTPPGAGAVSFAAQRTVTTGSGPHSVITADVNGDGKPDMIVANTGANTVSVLLNTTVPGSTMPNFATEQTFATGRLPLSVTTADLNGDGKSDLIVVNLFDDTVSVLLNNTAPGAVTPSFYAQQNFATGSTPVSVTAADVNGDGKPDLIEVNETDDCVSVLLNTTAPGASMPSFAVQQTFATGPTPFAVAAADVNGDGKTDLMVTNIGGGGDTVSLLLNTTAPGAIAPSFAAPENYATGSTPVSVTIADLNRDGKPDMIVANELSDTVSVLLNTTAPPGAILNFASQQSFAARSNPDSVAIADINGDGKRDVVVTNSTDNNVSVLLNITVAGAIAPAFATQQTFATGGSPNCVVAADVNGDGKLDLIVANADDNTVSALLNTTAPGSATPGFAAQQTYAVGTNPHSVAAVDVNGDGRPDLIVANSNDNTVSVLLNFTVPGATTPGFAAQQAFATGMFPTSTTAADINGDGKPDLIATNSSGNTVSVLLNTTAAGAATPSFVTQQTFATGTGPNSVTTADVNGDGKADLIMGNSGAIAVLLNTTAPGAATTSFATQQSFVAGLLNFPVTAEVNGDGKPDLIVADRFGNRVSILLNTTAPGAATPSFSAQQSFNVGGIPLAVAAADINGDGHPDVIATNAVLSKVAVFLNTQYRALFTGSPATGTIVHDYIFANGFE